MLNIITFDGTNLDEAIEYWSGHYIDLVNAQSIENRFLNLFNTMLWKEDEGLYDGERPTFDTDFDITIMKEIDGAERLDLQIVKTHIGTAPLTCLCTGTKFGILVNYYTKKGCKIVAGWGSAGENVFELIGRELDVTIYMDKRHMIDYSISNELENIIIDGITISEFDDRVLEDALCVVTHEKLKRAQLRLEQNFNRYHARIPWCAPCDYKGLNELLHTVYEDTVLEYAEDNPFLKELTYNIRATEIIVDTQDKYPTLWIFRKCGGTYKVTLGTICKWPTFMHMICEMEDIYQADTSMNEVFLVVFNTQGNVYVDYNYPKYVAYSLVYEPIRKSIDILGINETLEKIDEIIAGPEIITTEECPRKSEERWNI